MFFSTQSSSGFEKFSVFKRNFVFCKSKSCSKFFLFSFLIVLCIFRRWHVYRCFYVSISSFFFIMIQRARVNVSCQIKNMRVIFVSHRIKICVRVFLNITSNCAKITKFIFLLKFNIVLANALIEKNHFIFCRRVFQNARRKKSHAIFWKFFIFIAWFEKCWNKSYF